MTKKKKNKTHISPIGTKMKCPHKDCNYEWTTLTKNKMVTCPGCSRKIRRIEK